MALFRSETGFARNPRIWRIQRGLTKQLVVDQCFKNWKFIPIYWSIPTVNAQWGHLQYGKNGRMWQNDTFLMHGQLRRSWFHIRIAPVSHHARIIAKQLHGIRGRQSANLVRIACQMAGMYTSMRDWPFGTPDLGQSIPIIAGRQMQRFMTKLGSESLIHTRALFWQSKSAYARVCISSRSAHVRVRGNQHWFSTIPCGKHHWQLAPIVTIPA